jgi:hypothetical protein
VLSLTIGNEIGVVLLTQTKSSNLSFLLIDVVGFHSSIFGVSESVALSEAIVDISTAIYDIKFAVTDIFTGWGSSTDCALSRQVGELRH